MVVLAMAMAVVQGSKKCFFLVRSGAGDVGEQQVGNALGDVQKVTHVKQGIGHRVLHVGQERAHVPIVGRRLRTQDAPDIGDASGSYISLGSLDRYGDCEGIRHTLHILVVHPQSAYTAYDNVVVKDHLAAIVIFSLGLCQC